MTLSCHPFSPPTSSLKSEIHFSAIRKNKSINFGLVIYALIFFLLNSSTFAAIAITPAQIVGALYKPYLADPHAKHASTPDALDAISSYADLELKQAIQKDKACEERTQEICNIDFDVLIDAQDWDISEFKLKKENGHNKNQAVIKAEFLNGDHKTIINYFFIRDHKLWKIDDVEGNSFYPNGKLDVHYKLKELLLKNE